MKSHPKCDRVSLGEDMQEISRLKVGIEYRNDFIIWLCEEELHSEAELMQEKFNEWQAENEDQS